MHVYMCVYIYIYMTHRLGWAHAVQARLLWCSSQQNARICYRTFRNPHQKTESRQNKSSRNREGFFCTRAMGVVIVKWMLDVKGYFGCIPSTRRGFTQWYSGIRRGYSAICEKNSTTLWYDFQPFWSFTGISPELHWSFRFWKYDFVFGRAFSFSRNRFIIVCTVSLNSLNFWQRIFL